MTSKEPSGKPATRVSSDRGALVSTLVHLWPYIWPADRADLKLRVVAAMVLLLFAKLATIAVPFTFKWATDALAGHGSAPVASSAWLAWALAADHPGDHPVLHVVHLFGDRVAHRHPPTDERERHPSEHQGGRFAAQLRNGQIFRRRGARGAPLRPIHGALRGRQRKDLYLA